MINKLAHRLAAIEIWVVSVSVLASMIWSQLLLAAIGIAAFFWLIRWINDGRPSSRTPADWGILLLLLTLPVTLWATTMPEETQVQVYRLMTGIALYYAIANWGVTHHRFRLLLMGFILATIFLALFAPVSVEWTFSKLPFIPAELYQRFTLLVSDTIHPNVLAGNLVILLPIPLAILLFNWRSSGWLLRILASLATISTGGILLLSQSRGGLLALAMTLALFFVLRWRWGWVIIAITLLLALAFITNLGVDKFVDLLLAGGQSVKSVDGRLEIWSRTIYMIQDFPFTGIGMGSFMTLADRFYPFFIASPGTIYHAHNLPMQIAVDLGLPGLIAWLAIYFSILALSWQLYSSNRRSGQPLLVGIGAGLLGSQAALIVHGMLDAVTWGMVRPAPILWAIWGLAVAASRVHADSRSSNQQNSPSLKPA
ncbi:O-antigen ligase family protein [Chloroflexota bacterium]